MKKEVIITISGNANTGKSLVMAQIEKLLKENGFDVQLLFEDNFDYIDQNSFRLHNNISEKINSVKSNTKILLKEIQTCNAPN
jgi:uridine kinase